jgi:hypothetical protein
MKKILLAAAGAVVLFGAPALAMDAMMGHGNAMEATMLCRPAAAGEKPGAMMGSKGLVCKSMDKMMMAGGHMGPNTAGMSKADTDAAWQKWLHQAMLIQSNGPVGGNG